MTPASIVVDEDRLADVSSRDAGWNGVVARRAHNLEVPGSHPATATSRSCRSCWPRAAPTRADGSSRRAAATPLKTTRQRTSKFFVVHPSGLSAKVLHQAQLPFSEVVAVEDERALEIRPRPLEKLGVRSGPACQIP